MNNELQRFFNSINFNDENNSFTKSYVLKVILKKKEDLFEVNIKNDNVIDFNTMKKLFECAKKGINGDKKCIIIMHYDNVTNDDINSYLANLINELIEKRPSLVGIKDSNYIIDDEIISIEVNTKNEQDLILKESKYLTKSSDCFSLPTIGDTSISISALII